MPETEYSPESLQACEKALRTILTKIGTWGQEVYLIGGLVPRYLVSEPSPETVPHVGTTDLDVVIGITITTQDTEVYRTLQANLKQALFAPSRNAETGQTESFRWSREIDGLTVVLEFFCPVGQGTAGTVYRNPTSNTTESVGSQIGALRTRGAELVAMDYLSVSLRGELLDHGGIQEGVNARIANLLPFLVLKSFGLDGRDKDKDAYDIVWILNAWPGGIDGAIAAMERSPALQEASVEEAFAALRRNFLTLGHRGPAQYARFLAVDRDDEEGRIRLRRYAYGTLQTFFAKWDALGA